MGTPLRGLVVEDSEDDTVLMLRELRGGGYEPTHERVDTAAAMTDALGRQEWDVILADYMMPRFSAAAALTLLKDSGLDLPFIIVTGTVGEGIVVAGMKAGAHDYLFKGNLARLVPAVERELRDAEARRARRRAEEELLESRWKFEALVEHSPHAVVITDQEGRIVLVNRETERIFGYSRTELLGQTVEVLVPERLRRGHVRHRGRYLAGPSMRSLGASRCLLGRRKDGTEFPTEIGLSYVQTGDNVLVMSAIADMTERGQADEALRKTSETLQALVQASPVGIAILNPEGIVEMWNPAAERMFGWRVDEVRGQPLLTIPEGKEEEHRTLRERVLKGGASNGVELQRRAKDGALLDISLSTAPLRDPDGNVSGIVGMMADITERKRAEEKLQASETRFRRLFEAAQDGILVLGIDSGQVGDANPFLALLLGSSRQEMMGKRLWELGLFSDVEASKIAFAKLRREGYIRYEDLPLQTKDGRRAEVEFVSNVYDVNGSSVIQCNIRDITDRKRTEEELRRLTARLLEVQEDERRQTAYDIHDGLGQLMTAASMHLEAFAGYRDSADPEAADAEFVKARRCLQEAVVEMRRMVSELGPLLLEDVVLVEASRRLLSDMAERIGWETEFESEGMDERLDGMAETALFRIVQEALANIAKHADSPKVRVAFSRERDALQLEVRDWGRGFGVPDKPERGRHEIGR